jgi:multimeric flavodoxin WrbA
MLFFILDKEGIHGGIEMKVLMVNGSPHAKGNTYIALHEAEEEFKRNGVDVQMLNIGMKDIRGCIACRKCAETGKCVFDDAVNEAAPLFEEADGLIVGTPVYYASANATLVAFLDRLFYSTHFDKTMKVGASVVVARRGGLSATFDELNKYFTISGMPVASSYYWNSVHGRKPGEAAGDAEGLYNMRVLARNMTFLMKSIALGKEKYVMPETEEHAWTHFVRADLME